MAYGKKSARKVKKGKSGEKHMMPGMPMMKGKMMMKMKGKK